MSTRQANSPGSSDARRQAIVDALLSAVRELSGETHIPESALRKLSTDTTIEEDLGLDSLTRVELLSRIERRFGVRLDTETMAEVNTLDELSDALLRAGADSDRLLVHETRPLQLEEAESRPDSSQTLTDVLNWHAREHPNRLHVQFYDETGEGEVLTFGDLYSGASEVASGLQHDGLGVGETVALMLPTGKDYFFSFFGVLLAGGVPVSLYPPTRISQLEDHLRRHKKILDNCRASRLLAFPEVRAFSRLLKANVPSLKRIASLEDIRAEANEAALPRLHGEDVAFLQYTSGSTGNPKGVVLSHANLLANIRAIGEGMQATSKDVIVSWLPLYHDMGLIGCWLGSLYFACPLVVMSPMSFIAHPELWLWAIHRYRGTISAAPNFAYELCLNRIHPEQRKGLDLSCWRIACNGAEAVSPRTVHRFSKSFAREGFRENAMMPVYGLAENSVALCFPPLGRAPLIDRVQRDMFSKTGRADPASTDDDNTLAFVACGRPLRGNEIRIVDALNSEVPQRQEGRLQFRSPAATRGYYRNPEETKKLFHGDWLNSGDRAYMAAGEVYITGRSKDIITHGGRNLYPEELEQVVGDIKGIRKGCVAVFGSTEPESGTESLVVLAETRSTDPEEKEKLHSEIKLRALDVLGTPPDDVMLAPPHTVLKTSSGKIRRAACREAYEKKQLGPQDRPLYSQVTRLLSSALLPGLRRLGQAAGTALYGVWFWLVTVVLAAPVWLSLTLTPQERWRWPLIRAWGWVLTRLLGIRIHLRGVEHLPPAGSPAVFVANHSSYLDVFALLAYVPRPLHFVTKAELRKHWFTRTLLDRVGVEYVTRLDRQQSAQDAKRLEEKARAGESLFYFPEGTFTRVSGVYAFHMGAFVTAVKTGSPIVPVAIDGSRSVLRPGTRLPRRGEIIITVNEQLVAPKRSGEESYWAAAVDLRDRARQSILVNTSEPDLAGEHPPIW